jgi:hypothetical protein
MKVIPVDCANLTLMVGGAILAATSPDGSPRRNSAGQPLYNVPVIVVVEGGNADTLAVRVPGPVPQIASLTPIKFDGLSARPWSMDGGRSGVSFTAERLHPVAAKS